MAQPLQAWLRQQGVEAPFIALAELYPDAAVLVVDADHNILHWSAGAERLLGYRRDEVLGAHCLKGVRCPDCLRGCALLDPAGVVDQAVTCHPKDDPPRPLRRYGQGFTDASGAFLGGIELLIPAERSPSPAPAAPHQATETFHGILTRDPRMALAIQTIRNVAATDATVLVRGESGTGKELVARALHEESARRGRPFVAVNCAALTPSLVESELFGHVRGAFTGAVSDRVGLFAQADTGTLFLDEVAELGLDVQARLLRVLQERTFTPVGATRPVSVDVRIIAATHKALREEVRQGRFREDLMYRLRVVPLFLPALRERRADVELLLHHFLARNNARGPRHVTGIAPEAMRRLLDHAWPGNVREVQNVMDYAFAVGRGPEITLDELPPEFREAPADRPAPPVPGDRASAVRDALAPAGGHVGKAAEILGVSRATFWRWRREASG